MNVFAQKSSIIVETGDVQTIEFNIGTGATQLSVTAIPANALVLDRILNVTTPFSNGATISLGYSGSTTALMLTTDNDPQVSDSYGRRDPVTWSGSGLPVTVTVGGSPSVGAATVIVSYVSTPQP